MTLNQAFQNNNSADLDRRIEKEIAQLQNKLQFIDIMAQFWPWDTMNQKANRIQATLNLLMQKKQLIQAQQVQMTHRQLDTEPMSAFSKNREIATKGLGNTRIATRQLQPQQ